MFAKLRSVCILFFHYGVPQAHIHNRNDFLHSKVIVLKCIYQFEYCPQTSECGGSYRCKLSSSLWTDIDDRYRIPLWFLILVFSYFSHYCCYF